MSRRYYLGLNAGGPKALKTLFLHGTNADLRELSDYLAKKYQGTAILTKNGRSALALALKAYFDNGDKIIVTGFTCHAVFEAVTEAGMVPIFADINKEDLNFDITTLEKLVTRNGSRIKGIIVQNTLGNPVDMAAIEAFSQKHGLVIIEDLAHSVGVRYPDGRLAGTVGVATVFSFGKDKIINAISGGALVLRAPEKHEIKAPLHLPHFSDHLRAKFYPLLAAICRGLNYLHLGGVFMRLFQKIHWVEKSADNRLDLRCRLSKFEAKLALEQLRGIKRGTRLRDFYLVKDRERVLRELRAAQFFFDGFWYEKPISPARYYKEVKFPEKDCPVAVEVSNTIVNVPKYYKKSELAPALEIIKSYLIEDRSIANSREQAEGHNA